MARRVGLVSVLVTIGFASLLATAGAGAQDAACASALWLQAPVATASADEQAVREITAPARAWMSVELIDACSGETFSLTDFAGKTIYVEAMATWCPPCRDQLVRLNEALALLPEAEQTETVVVALSSEIGLAPEILADYAASNDFPFIFAVMSEEMLQLMVDDLGQAIVVAPATPHVVVAPDGAVGELLTGPESPEEVLALLKAAQESAAS